MIKLFKNRGDYLNLSDEELIRQYKETGEKHFVGVLFKRYSHLVFGVCMKYLKNEEDAEDASMEIFEELFEKLDSHDVEYFNGWIYSVSKNKCLMVLRKKKNVTSKKWNVYDNYYAENVENEPLWHHEEDEKKGLLKKLEEALINLKTEQQYCIRLMYLENRSYKEISVITGYSLKQVKSYIQNGKRKLKIFLENK